MKHSPLDLRILFLLVFSIVIFLFSFFLREFGTTCKTCIIRQPSVPESAQVTPVMYPVRIGEINAPVVTAQAAIIMDSDSKKILYEKNAFLRFAPASTVKIMTALVALESYELNQILTVKTEVWIPSRMGLVKGEEISFENLLYGLLLNSGNDAALAIAENYPGGELVFIERMNEKAKALQLQNTYFADAAGLNDDENFTSAHDLAILAAQALKNPVFSRVVSVKEITVFDKSGKVAHSLTNLNRLLGRLGVTGIKTGTSPGAGEVLVASSQQNGHTIIAVVIKSENRFADSSKLIEWAFSNFNFIDPFDVAQGKGS